MKTKYVNVVKTRYLLATLLALMFGITSCDKGFVDININPQGASTLDPAYELVSAQIMGTDQHHYEGEIAQQIQLLIGGQEEGGNFNTVNQGNMGGRFDFYFGTQVRNTINIINRCKDDAQRQNLYNMARILKAHSFMILVDTYGDVPYTEAGLAYISGINLPKYDKMDDIYLDLEKELKEATDALDATKDAVPGEIYFSGNIPRWKKYGNSLLLRLGMRYSKLNPTKAAAIVAIATDPARGGVMSANADNVIVKYNSVQNNPTNAFCQNSTKHNWFVSKPFIDFMQANSDPRLQYIAFLLPDPSKAPASSNVANTTPASQIGCPYGYKDVDIASAPGYPGPSSAGATYKYSQYNRSTVGRVDSWYYVITAAQTNLLMAEAKVRGWLPASITTTAQVFYETGVKAHMSQADMFATTNGGVSPITDVQATAYLAMPNIVYNAGTAIKQINEQYWAASMLMWAEAWHNRERSGFPVLTKNFISGQDASVTAGDGFIHRLMYTLKEMSANQVNTQAAAGRIGGDKLGTRVFWDI